MRKPYITKRKKSLNGLLGVVGENAEKSAGGKPETSARVNARRNIGSLLMIATVFVMTLVYNPGILSESAESLSTLSEKVLSLSPLGTDSKDSKGAPQVSAVSAIVIDAKNGEVLYEKDADRKSYPASTTKIMTALLTLEILDELESPVTQLVKIPDEAVGVEGSSIYLAKQEEVSIKDLLYGMMLRSGNDAAKALAVVTAGSEEIFVQQMNVRAIELGCENTHFVNPNGLFDENHYTTARDMAAISREAMKNDAFREIAATKDYRAGRAQDKCNYFYNKNKTVHQYSGGNGIKIGFTKASGRTLVASAERDGREIICALMNAPCWFQDAYALMDYCFLNK